MEVWSHDGNLYEVTSGYSRSDDARRYELTGLTGGPGTGPYIALVIPSAPPEDGPFIPGRTDAPGDNTPTLGKIMNATTSDSVGRERDGAPD